MENRSAGTPKGEGGHGFEAARWIWIDGDVAPRNAVAEFRTSFQAKGKGAFHLRISADSRYTLWVNGKRLAYGPNRNFPSHYEFDEHEVSGLLRPGSNLLAVRVQHWGEGNIQSFVSRAGLILEIVEAGRKVIVATDATWQARRSPYYEEVTPRIACMMPFEEQVVAGNENWQSEPAEWPPARVIGPSGCPPWGALSARKIPILTDEPWDCVSLREAGAATDPPLVVALRAGMALMPNARHMNLIQLDGLFAAELDVPRDGSLWIKHGAMYSGPVTLGLDGEALDFRQDDFDLIATRPVSAGRHVFWVDWRGLAHDSDIGITFGGIAGLRLRKLSEFGNSPWVVAPEPGRLRKALRSAPNLGVLLALPAAWQAVLPEALPRRDIYQSITCRTLEGGGKESSTTLPWTGKPLSGRRHHRLVLDFGRHALGFVELEMTTGAGSEIDAAGVEGINFGQIQFTELNNNTFSYVCRDGRQTFTSQLPRGLRYLVVDVRPQGAPVTLHAARVRVATYPWAPRGSFRCSDTRLNQIYELCTHTLRMSSMDTFVDATYEQALWVGDMASMVLQVHHYVQGEPLLPERSLRVAGQSLERMPLVNSQVPSAWEDRPIPNWSFLWALGVRDHFLFTGDLAFAAEFLPSLEKQAAFIERSLDAEGLFAMHGNVWHFLDWNGCENDHRHAATRTYSHENALAIVSLQATAEIAEALGDAAPAARWRKLARRMTAASRRAYWLADAAGFGETRAAGATSSQVTASAQICALMAGLFPKAKTRAAVGRILETNGNWRPTGTPWMWSLGARLACEAGRVDEVLPGIRRLWGTMLDRGATTAWEMFEGAHRPGLPTRSWCHGWSAGPAWLLPAYVLGVRPAAPGWRRVHIRPQLGDLQWAEGKIPTPLGIIRIRCERQPDGEVKVTKELPNGVEAE
ncbi:MAG: family 78 glycoside hydrolase catalytic domain [Akkermansiaceae bacterium]